MMLVTLSLILLMSRALMSEVIEPSLTCGGTGDPRKMFLCEVGNNEAAFELAIQRFTDRLLNKFDDTLYTKDRNGNYMDDGDGWRKPKKSTYEDPQFVIAAPLTMGADNNPLNLQLGEAVLFRRKMLGNYIASRDCDNECQDHVSAALSHTHPAGYSNTVKVHATLQLMYGTKGQALLEKGKDQRTIIYIYNGYVPCATTDSDKGNCMEDMSSLVTERRKNNQYFVMVYQRSSLARRTIGEPASECVSQLYLKKAGIPVLTFDINFDGSLQEINFVKNEFKKYVTVPYFQRLPFVNDHANPPSTHILLPICLIKKDFDIQRAISYRKQASVRLIDNGIRHCDNLCYELRKHSIVFQTCEEFDRCYHAG